MVPIVSHCKRQPDAATSGRDLTRTAAAPWPWCCRAVVAFGASRAMIPVSRHSNVTMARPRNGIDLMDPGGIPREGRRRERPCDGRGRVCGR